MSLERLISMTAACLLGAFALSGGQAAAQQPDDTSGSLTCLITASVVAGHSPSNVNSLATDTGQGQSYDPAQLFDTDPGAFTLSGTGNCLGIDMASEWIDKGGGTGPEFIDQQVSITAKGIYDNLICGTVDAKGTAVITDSSGPLDLTDHDIELHTQLAIKFVAGVGTMSIVVQGAPSESGQGTHSYIGGNQIDQGQGMGALNIIPTGSTGAGEPCVGTPGVQKSGDVTTVVFTGGFQTSLAGEGQTVISPSSDSDQ